MTSMLAVLGALAAAPQDETSDAFLRPIAALDRARFIHEADVESAVLSECREELFCAEVGGTVSAWDIRSGVRKWRRRFTSGPYDRQRLALSPDGRRLALGSAGSSTRVIDTAGGTELRAFDGCSAPAFSPDSRVLAGIHGKVIRRWRLDTGQELRRIESPHPLHRLAPFPDELRIAATYAGVRGFGIWNLETGRLIHAQESSGNEVPFTSVAVAPTGDALALGDFWGALACRIRDHRLDLVGRVAEAGGSHVQFSADGTRILGIHSRRIAAAIDATANTTLQEWSHRQGHGFLAFSDGGRFLIRAVEGMITLEGTEPPPSLVDVTFTERGKILTLSEGGGVRLIDPATLRPIESRSGPATRVMTIARDGRTALLVPDPGLVRVVDLALGAELLRVKWKGLLDVAALSPDGRTLAVSMTGAAVTFWDVPGRRERCRIPIAGRTVTAIALRTDGRRAAWGERTGALVVADTEKGQETTRFVPRGPWITAIAFSGDGTAIATGEHTGEVRLWNVVGGENPEMLIHHQAHIHTVAITADGTRVASTSDSGIYLHDSPIRTRPLGAHPEAFIRALAFSPDGKLLAGGGSGGSLLWRLP